MHRVVLSLSCRHFCRNIIVCLKTNCHRWRQNDKNRILRIKENGHDKKTIDYIRIFCRFVVFVVRCRPATTSTGIQHVFFFPLAEGSFAPTNRERKIGKTLLQGLPQPRPDDAMSVKRWRVCLCKKTHSIRCRTKTGDSLCRDNGRGTHLEQVLAH